MIRIREFRLKPAKLDPSDISIEVQHKDVNELVAIKGVLQELSVISSAVTATDVNDYSAFRDDASFTATWCALPVVPGTSVADRFPEVAVDWHPTLNGLLLPSDFSASARDYAWWLCSRNHAWRARICNRTLRQTGCHFCSNQKPVKGENDLAAVAPELAAMWHPTLNDKPSPDMVLPKSNKTAWWICARGHEFERSIRSQYKAINPCPQCKPRPVFRTLSGINDLATTHPEMAMQFDHEKNAGLSPKSLTRGSKIPIWWKCEAGHSWQCSPNHRKTASCPICDGKRVVSGINDLETLYPEIAAQFDKTRNVGLNPAHLSPGSSQCVWWLCSKGHSWRTSVHQRVGRRTQCPKCTGRIAIAGETDLATTYPALLQEWDYTRNTIAPESVKAGTEKKVWWLCSRGHAWEARISNRTALDRGCPYCTHQLVLSGETDLATLHPGIAAEWHPHKNLPLLPTQVFPNAKAKVWWLCGLGHEWQTAVANRTAGRGCQVCSGQAELPGFNDLVTLRPEIAVEWHPTRNGVLQPDGVTKSSGKKVWWRCSQGHEWQQTIAYRTARNSKCLVCSKRKRNNANRDAGTP